MTNALKRNVSFHLLVLIPLLAHSAGCRTADASPAACSGPVEVRTAEDAAALSGCRSIDGDLRVIGPVEEIHLEQLSSVRYLVVAGTSLESLQGLSGLTEAAGVTVAGNVRLTSLRGLEGLRRADGVVITGNEALASMDGLEGLERIGELTVDSNPRLTSLAGLASLVEAREVDVSAATNPALPAQELVLLEARASRSLALGR